MVRLTGNDSVHAGILEDEDSKGRTIFLFKIVNLLVGERIGMGMRLKEALAEFPPSTLEQIERRNKK